MESCPSVYIGVPFAYVLAGWCRVIKFRKVAGSILFKMGCEAS